MDTYGCGSCFTTVRMFPFRMLSLCQYPLEMMTLFTAHVMTAPGLILHLNKSAPEVRKNLFCNIIFCGMG